MNIRTGSALMAGLVLAAPRIHGQAVRTLDAVAIQRAMAVGASTARLEPYAITAQTSGLSKGRGDTAIGVYTTPYLRVALAARDAKKLYRPFTAADVTEAMVRPVMEVFGLSQPQETFLSGRTGVIGNVREILITRVGGQGGATRPIESVPIPMIWKNLLGFSAESDGLMATFPIELLTAENELHVIYDIKVKRLCDDCVMRFKPDKVK